MSGHDGARRASSGRLVQRLAGIVLLLAALCAGRDAGAGPESQRIPLSQYPRETIAIESGSIRRHLFDAWRAESSAERAQGLMFVRDDEMRPDQAMIFVYEPPQYVAMWMKNTLLPLDMLFVDQRGCVRTIHEHAKPGSLANIESGVPVVLVVELKAGTVARLRLRTGDRLLRLDRRWPRGEADCRAGTR